MNIEQLIRRQPVIPVITFENLEDALPVAEALIAGGLDTLEITLRTAVGLKAIQEIKGKLPQVTVAAGTVVNTELLHSALNAGADFIVTPGTTPALIKAAVTHSIPLLPGASTASEAMTLLDQGFSIQKFFPAAAAGGIAMLQALAGPLPQISFCPTGGITPDNAEQYLALDNVACVGGSWLTPPDLIQQKNWSAIQSLAQAAAGFNQHFTT